MKTTSRWYWCVPAALLLCVPVLWWTRHKPAEPPPAVVTPAAFSVQPYPDVPATRAANEDGYVRGVRDGVKLGNLEGLSRRVLVGLEAPPLMPRAD